MSKPNPVIDCTDLYHPHQDPGDNFDIITPFALPEIDLKAVILDVTDEFRNTPKEKYIQHHGPREPGIIPMTQLNFIFDKTVPFGLSAFHRLKSPNDNLKDAPYFQQDGVNLMIKTLRESPEPVTIMVFCSCRTLAAAINREPELFAKKTKRLILSIGTTSGELFDVNWHAKKRLPLANGSSGYLEWNVALDPHAYVRVLRSGLPMSLYPCASDLGPFALHRHNSFYKLDSMAFVHQISPRLQRYLSYVFKREVGNDFIRAMERDLTMEELSELASTEYKNIWETAPWIEASGRLLVRRLNGSHHIIPKSEIQAGDFILPNDQRPCKLNVHDDGRFDFELTDGPSEISIYDRGEDLEYHQKAMGEALGNLYATYLKK